MDRSICGNDLHDDVGSTLVPVTSENGTYSTYLFTQKAIEIIEAQDPEQVSEEIYVSKHVDGYGIAVGRNGRYRWSGMVGYGSHVKCVQARTLQSKFSFMIR